MFIPIISLVVLSYAVVVNGSFCSWQRGDSIPIGTRCVLTGGDFHFRDDGNLVIRKPNGQTLWETKTSGKGYEIRFQQSDGNVVMVDRNGKTVWHVGKLGANFLRFGHDRNFVLTKDGVVVWAANTEMSRDELRTAVAILETNADNSQQQITAIQQQLAAQQTQSNWLMQQLSGCWRQC